MEKSGAGRHGAERGITMKKFMSILLSAVVLMSVAAGTAFAAVSAPSKTGSDADAGAANYTISGTGTGLEVKIEVTEASEREEAALQAVGGSLTAYADAQVADDLAGLLGTTADSITMNEIKQLEVAGYMNSMGRVTISAPFAALPANNTRVVVLIKVTGHDDSVNWITVPGVVEEKALGEGGKSVRCVTFTLDEAAMQSVQSGTATIGAVTKK